MSTAAGRIGRPIAENILSDATLVTGIAKRLLSDVRELTPHITARSAEIEAARRIPLDLVKTLRSIGAFRMFVPRSHGGLELDLAAGLEIISALARIDASVGWCVMIASGGSIFAPSLARDTYERVYESGPDVIFAGSTQPAGTAEATADGWRVSGRWPFASGCQHADWMLGLCAITDGGKPLLGKGGQPLIRGIFLPAHEWHIEDTWHVAGLKGTGSHHIALKDVVVARENFFDVESVPCVPGPLYQSVWHLLPVLHGAVDIGIAEGAVDDLVELARAGRQQLRAAVPMRESEAFQFELGRITADLRAAQALHHSQVTNHWRHALAGTLKDDALLTQGTQAAIWVATTCVRVADAGFALAGGSAVYESSPLQRRVRDLHVAAQHAAVQRRHYATAGKAALAQFHPSDGRGRRAAQERLSTR